MRALACIAVIAAGSLLAGGCIPIGARVQNMYAQGPAPAQPAAAAPASAR